MDVSRIEKVIAAGRSEMDYMVQCGYPIAELEKSWKYATIEYLANMVAIVRQIQSEQTSATIEKGK